MMTWERGPRLKFVLAQATGADGRAVFVFDPPFQTPPIVTKDLLYAAAAGCTVTTIGDPRTTGVTVEVRRNDQPAANVTVQIRAEAV